MTLLYSFLKDMRLALKSYYLYLEIFIALIFIALVLFVLPETPETTGKVYLYSEDVLTVPSLLGEALGHDGLEVIPVESGDALREAMAKDRNGFGIDVGIYEGKPRITFILQGYEGERLRNMLTTSVESSLAALSADYREATVVRTLSDNSEKLPWRIDMLPVYLAMNASFMGLFIIAAYIFLDKDEGTIKAFAVTPAHVWHYLASKMGVILVTCLLTGLLTVLAIAGGKANYPHLLSLLVTTNLFGTAFGLFISSCFDDLTSAMGWLYVSIMVLGAASVSYYIPSFSPLAIRLLPSYPMLFAYREVFLSKPDLPFIYANVAGFAAGGIVFFLLANRQFKKRMTA